MAEKLKSYLTVDTSEFKKGMRDAKATLNDFEKDGKEALSSVASMFGVSSGAIGDVVKKLGQAGDAFKLLGTTGEGASKAMTVGMKTLAASIAGLGIMAAVAAFRELNSEASNFEQRLQGVNLAASAKASRNTYRQAMLDASGAGEKWAKFTEFVKTDLSRGFTNIATVILGGANVSDIAEADRKAARAAELASDMVDYKRAERDLGIEIQRIDNQIAEAQSTFRNAQANTTARKKAEATLTELINQKYDKQAALQQRMLDNVKERNSLTTSTEAELDEEANLTNGLLALEGRRQQEKNAMLRTSNSIANAAMRTKESVEQTVSLLEQVVGSGMADILEKALDNERIKNDVVVQRIYDEGFLDMMRNVPGFNNEAIIIKIPVAPEIDREASQKAIIELADILEFGVAGMSEALGDLIGDLVNGENAWGNFAQAGISVIADMLSTVGKAFIAEGMGVIAAQSALVTGGGAGAVAAGAAMVALAATMKRAMSNASANWGSGYSTSVASSAYSSGTQGVSSFGREMEIKVTGTLTANGSKLVAVLNNEKNRTDYTT